MTDDGAPFYGVPPGGAQPDAVRWLTTADGVRLRAAFWSARAPRGHVLLLPGRTEYLEKVALTAAGFVDRGLSVLSLDWRGQGLSDRLIEPPGKGHVGDFSEYLSDLEALLSIPEAADLPGPRLMLGHSMGGLIGLAALHRPIGRSVDAAILSAPLFGLSLPLAMHAFAWLGIRIAKAIGRMDRWPPFGDVTTTYALSNPADNVLTSNENLWAWMVESARANPELTLAMPSIAWVDAAQREMRRVTSLPTPSCPVACLVGTDERVVSLPAVRTWSTRHGAELIEIEGARHEPQFEASPLAAAAWDGIDRFLDRTGILPPAR